MRAQMNPGIRILNKRGAAPFMPSRYPAAWLDELRSRSDIVQIISGYVPAMLNGEYVHILLSWYGSTESWEITGLRADYRDEETETIAKGVPALTDPIPQDDAEIYINYRSSALAPDAPEGEVILHDG